MQRELQGKQVGPKKPPARSASDGDKAFNSSGLDSEALAKNGSHQYNTSGHINLGKKLSQPSTAPDTDHNGVKLHMTKPKLGTHQYFSGNNAT